MVIGARIVDVHSVHSTEEGLDHCQCYFTCDRGFTFYLPSGGDIWETTSVPDQAARLEDRVTVSSFAVKHGWFGRMSFQREADTTDDTGYRLKQQAIAQVLCGPLDPDLGFYVPWDTVLVMSDGYRLSCCPVAPHGTGAVGLYYQSPDKKCIAQMTDYFTIPITPSENLKLSDNRRE